MQTTEPLVYIVLDDDELCASLSWFLESVSVKSQAFNDVQSFLAEYDATIHSRLLLDVCPIPAVSNFRRP